MVRPRTGDFLYSEDEFNIMLEDASIFIEHGVAGVVAGFLTPEGDVDAFKTSRFAHVAEPVEFCFHRAFDMTQDLARSFDVLGGIRGVNRILTSGGGTTAPQSLPVLKTLLQKSQLLLEQENRTLTILPGSGINDKTIQNIFTLLPDGLQEVHLSGGTWVDGGMQHRVDGMGMGIGGAGEWGRWVTQTERVRAVCAQIHEAKGREKVSG